jgi:hypothetical protein
MHHCAWLQFIFEVFPFTSLSLSLSLSLLLPVTYSFLLSCAPNFALKAQPCHLRLKEVVNNKSSGGQQKKASLETKPEIKY